MLRSILLPLDGSHSSQRVIEFGIGIARRLVQMCPEAKAVELTGISIVDTPTIAAPAAVPIGGAAFKQHRDQIMLAEAAHKTRQFLSHFVDRCEQAGTPCNTIHTKGLPSVEIANACRTHDVVLIGRETNFHFETSSGNDDTAIRLLRDHPRPLIAVDSMISEVGDILVAYDGSLPSSRSLHMFLVLGLLQLGRKVHIVCVDNHSEEQAKSLAGQAERLVQRHDGIAVTHPIYSRLQVSELLLDKVSRLNPILVVMGSFGHTGIQTWFFGSTTNEMYQSCPAPLFLYH